MRNQEKHDKNKEAVYNLLTEEFQTTQEIKNKGIQKGLFSNWVTYNIYLMELETEKKAQKMKTKIAIFWRKI